jgi:hypothetical protein
MAHRRKLRAARRNAERQRRHLSAREVAVELDEERPKRRYARSKTILEGLMVRGSISTAQMRAGDRLALDYHYSWTDPNHLTAPTSPGRVHRSASRRGRTRRRAWRRASASRTRGRPWGKS